MKTRLVYKTPPETKAKPEWPLRIMRRGKVIKSKTVCVIRIKGVKIFGTHKSLKTFNTDIEECVYVGPVIFSAERILVKKLAIEW